MYLILWILHGFVKLNPHKMWELFVMIYNLLVRSILHKIKIVKKGQLYLFSAWHFFVKCDMIKQNELELANIYLWCDQAKWVGTR